MPTSRKPTEPRAIGKPTPLHTERVAPARMESAEGNEPSRKSAISTARGNQPPTTVRTGGIVQGVAKVVNRARVARQVVKPGKRQPVRNTALDKLPEHPEARARRDATRPDANTFRPDISSAGGGSVPVSHRGRKGPGNAYLQMLSMESGRTLDGGFFYMQGGANAMLGGFRAAQRQVNRLH